MHCERYIYSRGLEVEPTMGPRGKSLSRGSSDKIPQTLKLLKPFILINIKSF